MCKPVVPEPFDFCGRPCCPYCFVGDDGLSGVDMMARDLLGRSPYDDERIMLNIAAEKIHAENVRLNEEGPEPPPDKSVEYFLRSKRKEAEREARAVAKAKDTRPVLDHMDLTKQTVEPAPTFRARMYRSDGSVLDVPVFTWDFETTQVADKLQERPVDAEKRIRFDPNIWARSAQSRIARSWAQDYAAQVDKQIMDANEEYRRQTQSIQEEKEKEKVPSGGGYPKQNVNWTELNKKPINYRK